MDQVDNDGTSLPFLARRMVTVHQRIPVTAMMRNSSEVVTSLEASPCPTDLVRQERALKYQSREEKHLCRRTGYEPPPHHHHICIYNIIYPGV